MQVDVEPDAAALGDREQAVQLGDRVPVDRRGVDPADARHAGCGRLIEQLQHAGTPDHAVLRERHDLHLDRAGQRGRRRADRLDAAQPDPEVDVDMGAGRGRPVPQELPQHRRGARRRSGIPSASRSARSCAIRPCVVASPPYGTQGRPHQLLSTCACALTKPGSASRPPPSTRSPAAAAVPAGPTRSMRPSAITMSTGSAPHGRTFERIIARWYTKSRPGRSRAIAWPVARCSVASASTRATSRSAIGGVQLGVLLGDRDQVAVLAEQPAHPAAHRPLQLAEQLVRRQRGDDLVEVRGRPVRAHRVPGPGGVQLGVDGGSQPVQARAGTPLGGQPERQRLERRPAPRSDPRRPRR